MKEINIRPARTDDLIKLLEFEQGVISAERPFDNTLGQDPIHYYNLKKLMESEHSQLLVAEMDGELIASGYARIEDAKPYLDHKKYAYLGFMYVHPNFRGNGVNAKIIQNLAIWAKKQNILELRLDVYDENLSAVKAYQKAGFQSHLLNMRMRL